MSKIFNNRIAFQIKLSILECFFNLMDFNEILSSKVIHLTNFLAILTNICQRLFIYEMEFSPFFFLFQFKNERFLKLLLYKILVDFRIRNSFF